MSDTLINKYRPKTFDAVLGHEAAVRSLKSNIIKKRARTFLLTGPSGIGKTTLARIAAKEAGCHKHDIYEANGTVDNGIDDSRKILEMIQYKPMHGDASAVIIDEFQGLTKQAVQALLKALEEPPEHLYWFICTTEPSKIPNNIKTRCVTAHLKAVNSDELVAHLNFVAGKEKIKVSPKIISLCVDEAAGSPRQALTNLGAVVGAKTVEEAQDLLASHAESKEAVDLCRLLLKGIGMRDFEDVQSILRRMRETQQNPENIRVTIQRYVGAVAMNARGGFLAKVMPVLEVFDTPFPPQDGLTPILTACWRLAKRNDR